MEALLCLWAAVLEDLRLCDFGAVQRIVYRLGIFPSVRRELGTLNLERVTPHSVHLEQIGLPLLSRCSIVDPCGDCPALALVRGYADRVQMTDDPEPCLEAVP